MNSNLMKLLESSVLNEETKTSLLEAWDGMITEAREEISAELREEFANRYQHDKRLVVEATDKMIQESLKKEFDELAEDKKAIKETRVALEKQKVKMAESTAKFIKKVLESEIKEFRTERKQVNEGIMKLQKFVNKQLTEEIADFAKDKVALTEERILFEKNKKKVMAEAKKQFITKAATLSEKVIREALTSEISQLRQDLNESKKKAFGAKLFEAFAAEYMSSHYNEKSHVSNMNKVLENLKKQLTEAKNTIEAKNSQLNEAKKQVRVIKEMKERNEQLNKLLSPLNKEQRQVMNKLLENVQTSNLSDNFRKYISIVLKEDGTTTKQKLTENSKPSIKTEYNGNRSEDTSNDDFNSTLMEIKRLSGIKIKE